MSDNFNVESFIKSLSLEYLPFSNLLLFKGDKTALEKVREEFDNPVFLIKSDSYYTIECLVRISQNRKYYIASVRVKNNLEGNTVRFKRIVERTDEDNINESCTFDKFQEEE